LTASGKAFLDKYSGQLAPAQAAIQTVPSGSGKRAFPILEKLATALWLRKETPGANEADLTQEMHRIKPHISPVDARQALRDEAALSA